MRRIARFEMTQEFLVHTLHLPADTRVVGARVNVHGHIEMTVEHPDLKPQEEGAVGMVTPVLRTDLDGRVTFESWEQ